MLLQAKEHQSFARKPPETREEAWNIFLTSSEGNTSADTLILDLEPSEMWGNMFLLFKSQNLWYFVKAVLAN